MDSIQNFAITTSKQWKALDKDYILEEILASFVETRENPFNELKVSNQFGIYAFFIKPNRGYESCESLNKAWNIEPFKKFPKIVKKRFEVCEAEDGWFPFYIGKSEKLGTRMYFPEIG